MSKPKVQSSNRLLLVCGALAAAYLVACSNAPTRQPIITTPERGTAQVPGQEQPAVTDTPSPTATHTPTVTAPSPTSTPAPLPPALTKEEALKFVISLQETNGGCELPCWWGITPGETMGKFAKQALSPLRDFMKFFVGYLGGSEARYEFRLEEYNNIRSELIMKDEEQPVGEIWVFSFIPDEDRSTRYHESWRRYFLDEVLTRIGTPSDVWLGFGPHTGDRDERPPQSIPYFYELYVIYSDLGLILQYAGPAIQGEPNRACLSFDQLKEMRIYSRRRSRGPLVGPPWEPFTYARPTSEIMGVSVEEFYETFRNLEGQPCLESPAKYWP